MKFKLEFDMDNDAFWIEIDNNGPVILNCLEINRIIKNVSMQVLDYNDIESGKLAILHDVNGNTIGQWEITNNV